MNKIVGRGFLISWPNVSEIFIILSDASKMYIGRVISGKWEFNFFLRKQVNPHLNKLYNCSKKNVQYIETLKIIPYDSIKVSYCKYGPHLSNDNLMTDTVLCRRLLL